jgi:large subunit ribosomal protein L23
MEILKKPVVTEKMTLLTDKQQQYAFLVYRRANKNQIRTAVESMYGVTVESVNTMRYAGDARSRSTKAGIQRGRKESKKMPASGAANR